MKKIKMCLNEVFGPILAVSRGLGSFVTVLVCWQIDFIYNQFSKLFCKTSEF